MKSICRSIRWLAAPLAAVLAQVAPAQLAPGRVVVATNLPGSPTAVLLEVDLATGNRSRLGRFAHDAAPLLAVDVDRVNGDLVVAVDLGGSSRLLRLQLDGLRVANTTVLADLPGTVRHLSVAALAEPYALTGGSNGALWRVPRNGGTPTRVLAFPRASAMTDTGITSELATVVQSGSSGPPRVDPAGTSVALRTGQSSPAPWSLPAPAPVVVTGIFEIPAALPRYLFSHDTGAITMVSFPQLAAPVVVPLQPPLPAGGAVAMRGLDAILPIVLGGAAHPFLQSFDPFQAAPTWRVLAGPLPGDPVDYALAPGPAGYVQEFGESCGVPAVGMWGNLGGRPRLGNPAFSLTAIGAPPASPVLLVLGLSERSTAGMPLPLVLPNGCPLLVAPDAVTLHLTDARGNFERLLPIPGNPAVLGFTFFGQWLLASGPAFPVSQAAAVHVGR